jgi:GNAT superfamily N-acetyltransferase
MHVRAAKAEDAEDACRVIRRSIAELCHADHRGDVHTLNLWLANKTLENMRRWISQNHVFVATQADAVIGVGAIRSSGEVMLNYVSPDARFSGVSRAIMGRLEAQARELGVDTITLLSSATARQFYMALGYRGTGTPVRGFGVTLGFPMAKPLSRKALPLVECSVVFLSASEGGRTSPLSQGALSGNAYRPHLVIDQPTQRRAIVADGNRLVEEYIGVAFHKGPAIPEVGTEMIVVMTLIYSPNRMYDALKPGVTFTLREGSQVVGYGRVRGRL